MSTLGGVSGTAVSESVARNLGTEKGCMCCEDFRSGLEGSKPIFEGIHAVSDL